MPVSWQFHQTYNFGDVFFCFCFVTPVVTIVTVTVRVANNFLSSCIDKYIISIADVSVYSAAKQTWRVVRNKSVQNNFVFQLWEIQTTSCDCFTIKAVPAFECIIGPVCKDLGGSFDRESLYYLWVRFMCISTENTIRIIVFSLP